MKSMTGYGRGVSTLPDGTQVTVEITSVNSKRQVDIRIVMPRELLALEPDVRMQVTKSLVRGTLTVTVSYTMSNAVCVERVPFDDNMAKAVAERLRRFALNNGFAPPSLHDVLVVPGVIQATDAANTIFKPLVSQALAKALQELDAMRQREGAALKADLLSHVQVMEDRLEQIRGSEQEALVRYRDKLVERISKLAVNIPVDDERIAREVAFYADKSDINEETVRLQSHLTQFRNLLDSDGDIGRNLDFLGQEMTRETSTLDAKTTDSQISDLALTLKIELSKLKEQIMNVE